ncbi:MAG: 1-(5-phosphoribosyl)-5-amino-4-imidazole-carboxylate carboxylase [Gemmatimonadetes bacterium]|nr:1-(5-phosphoribosyl)-5-amino-4-imidazole-carboxylate carboxylase [Gemmatimonadota bacterium]
MTPERVRALLAEVAAGALTPADAERKLAWAPTESLPFATIDHHRALRSGFPEVVFGAGKTPEQVAAIAERIAARGAGVLATRVDAAASALLVERIPGIEINDLGRTAFLAPDEPPLRPVRGDVLIVTAGTSDLPVAEEAAVTAHAFGCPVKRLTDVGVAGIHRLLAAGDALQDAAVVIVVAGMEGALPSVVGGLVSCPVIAVPTSVGYGAAFGGIAALLGMLNSCASGVTVVNIDNGFGAASAAARINLLPPS